MPTALRLNKRRDESVVLTDSHGIASAADREFPSEFFFGFDWLLGAGAPLAGPDGDKLVLTLANGTATYSIAERKPAGLQCTLVESELSDAPPIDEDKAADVAAARAEREAKEGRSGPTSRANGGSASVSVPNEPEGVS